MPTQSSSSKAYPGEPTLLVKGGPDPAMRASEQHAAAALLVSTLAAPRQVPDSLPLDFHQLSTAHQSTNPELRAMAETAHRLVDHNLLGHAELENLRVRHTDLQDKRVSAAIEEASGIAALSARISNFNPSNKGITVVEQDTARFLRQNEKPDALRELVFAHELGHAVHSGHEVLDVLKSAPKGLLHPFAESPQSAERALYAEMRADVFALAATAVTKGTAEASALAEVVMVGREREHGNWLNAASRQPQAVPSYNDHHTTAAVAEFKSQLAAGRFSGPQTPESFNQALTEIAAKGLLKEMEQVPKNWLGGHQLGPDNKLTPLSPEVRAALLETTQKHALSDYRWDRANVRLVMPPDVAQQVVLSGAQPRHTAQLEVQGKAYTVLSVEPPATLSLPAHGDAPARTLKVEEGSLGIVQAAKAQALEVERLISPRAPAPALAEPKAATPSLDRER